MRIGYSSLLGEYVDAESISHRDCEPFQIVCPVCREPVFKVERTSEDKSLEYLSHYRQTESYASECELRVASTSYVERRAHNSESRQQKLEYFLAVFRKLLEKDPHLSYSKGLEYSHKQINHAKAWCFFRTQHFESGRRGGMAERSQFENAARFYLNEVNELGGVPKTGFSSATQIRIAADLMATLSTQHGKTNYEALFNHAAIYLLQRCRTPAPSETPESIEVMKNVAYFASGLMRSGKRDGMQLIANMNASPIYPPFVETPATYLLKVAAEIGHEMVGTLLRLPYFEFLKNNRTVNV